MIQSINTTGWQKKLKSGLDHNGLMDLGNTYLADNKLQNGKIAQRALEDKL